MTELKRLEISGIRSFKENPDDINKQSIDFDGPVTLITGENGTGKTTIIEALKFATMGKCTEEMITDPNIWGKDKIESRVSLEFKSANQNSYKVILTPSIKKTQSNKKGKSFERGECEVITTTPEGVKTQNYINVSKDAEIQLPNNFGVSPPIIENVIFCHQKDSCWPIDSSARELKEKFDQIFGAEKYNGAIKALKGTQKALNEELHKQETIVGRQTERQENYLRSEKKIIKLKQEIIDIDDDVNEKQMLFEQIDSQLNEYNKIQPSIDRINNEIQKIKGELTSDENNMKVQIKKIKNMQPKENCSSALEDVTALIKAKKDEQETNSKCLKESRSKQNLLEEEKDNLKKKFEKISEELDSAKSEQNFYLQKMRQFKDSYKSENLDDTLDQKRNAYAQADEDFKKLDGKSLSAKDQEIRTDEINLSNHKAQASALAKNIENFDSQLSKINDVDEEKLQDKENTIKNIQKELDDFINSDKNPDALSKIIENKTSEREDLNQKKQIRMAMKEKCDQNSVNVNKLKNADDQIKSATERINFHLKIIQDGLDDHTINSKDAKTKFSEKCSELNDMIKKLKSERLEINKNSISASTNLQREQADLEKRENEAKIAKDNIDRENTDDDFVLTDDGESYKNHCELIENCLNEENDKLSRLNNSENVYKDFRNKAETRNSNNHHSCPLCEREFESDSDYEKFLSEHIDNFVVSLPKEIKKAQLNKNMYKNKLEKLKKIENDVKIYIDYQKNKDEWLNNIQSLQKEEKEFTEKLKAKDEEIKIIEDAIENLQKIAVNVDNLIQAVADEKNFSDLKEGLSSKIDKDLPSVVDIQNEINELDKEIDNLSNEINNLYKEQNHFTNEKNILTSRIESLSQEYDHMKTDLANKESLIKKADKQRDEIYTHQQNIEQIEAELQRLRLEYKELQTNFEKEKEEKAKQRDNAQFEYNNCKDLVATIKQSQETLKKVESGEMAEYHTELKSELDRKEEEYKKLTDEINRYNDENNELNKQILQLKEEEADLNLLNDYYKVKENSDFLHSKLKNLEDEKARILSRFDDMNIKELTTQHREYSRILTEAKTNKANAEKNLEEEQANSKDYEDSRKLLSKATIHLKSIELAISDITRYIKALDKTILDYHSQKMREINDTIETLWSNTYFGQDIDTIYIRCEEEKAKNAQYNYRVVMKKNGIELDMDRRCSAGQKMLASIIIRLALAQTFALNCGIIALDEPTTNLDEPNRKNLASQLIDLVNAQEDFNFKKTFQLIIITHSREFVQSLVEEGKIDCFYQITRAIDDSHHCSQIQKCYETNLVIGH